MGLKIVYHTESQGVKKISLTAMPLGGLGGKKSRDRSETCLYNDIYD